MIDDTPDLMEAPYADGASRRVAPRTVKVSREIAVSAEAIWRALTEPTAVGCWFGDVDRFVAGQPFRCEFGDGDFFSGRTLRTVDGGALDLEWQFMGIGPRFCIGYRLARSLSGATTVTVTDTGAPTDAEAESLREGWMDFLARLDGYVSTGARTRYAWNPSIAIGAIARNPAALISAEWLGEHFGAAALGLFQRPDGGFDADFREPHWPPGVTMAAAIDVHALEDEFVHIAVTHPGWPSLPQAQQLPERRRYAAAWRAALAALEAAHLAR